MKVCAYSLIQLAELQVSRVSFKSQPDQKDAVSIARGRGKSY